MWASSLAIALGVGLLWVGGEQFVLGASRLAERTRLPQILIGMVVAGFGTSAPEMAVSVLAQRAGEYEVALGNVLGSNVANILLVLSAAALIRPWPSRGGVLRREIVAVLGMTALLIAFASDGSVGRAEAGVLLTGFVATFGWLVASALAARNRATVEREIREMIGPAPHRADVWREAARTALGLAVVLLAADRLVWGAGRIARDLGVAEGVIGLTLVALGTSLPELVTSVVAARRGEPDLVLGNVLGSNLFNGLLIAGVAGLVAPLELTVGLRTITFVAAGASALVTIAFLREGFVLGRRHAGLLLGGYATFVVLTYLA